MKIATTIAMAFCAGTSVLAGIAQWDTTNGNQWLSIGGLWALLLITRLERPQ